MSREKRFRLGITHGDVNGIGYEVILKALSDQRMYDNIIPVVYGSTKVASYHRKTLRNCDVNFQGIRHLDEATNKRVNILNITDQEIRVELGFPSEEAGRMAVLSLEMALKDLREGHLEAIVTAPFDKHTVQSADFSFPGHTEYLANAFGLEEHLMFMIGNQMRVGLVTGHLPLRSVPDALSTDRIMRKLELMNQSLVRDFGIEKPRIAVLGVNPHAGDDGLLGSEEKEIILPAVTRAFEKGMAVFGPYPPDGFFGSLAFQKFDGILAMYHDQGLIPFKLHSFHEGVNYTAGLPVVRTSPAHGTGYDIAGKDQASSDSMREAIYLAYDIFHHRTLHDELKANALDKR